MLNCLMGACLSSHTAWLDLVKAHNDHIMWVGDFYVNLILPRCEDAVSLKNDPFQIENSLERP